MASALAQEGLTRSFIKVSLPNEISLAMRAAIVADGTKNIASNGNHREKGDIMFRAALLIGLMVITSGGLTATIGSRTANAATPDQLCATSDVIEIQHFAFNPSVIPRGGASAAILTAVNCTDHSLSATETWVGYFAGPNGPIGSGCPVLVPLVESVAVSPNGTFTSSIPYTVPASCPATQLIVMADINAGSGVPPVQGTAILNVLTPTG